MKFIIYSIAALMVFIGIGCIEDAITMRYGGLFAVMQGTGGVLFILSGLGLGCTCD